MKLRDRKRKRVLFVFRDFVADTPAAKTSEYIIKSLRKKYDIETYRNLGSGVIELIRSNLSSNKFDALITHVPHSRSFSSYSGLRYFREMIETESAYRESLDILQRIKMINDMPIIAYTGAGDSSTIYSIFMEGGGVDHIVHKSTDFQNDSKEILSVLENLLHKYKQIPQDIPKLVIRTEKGYVIAEVRVNLNTGIGLVSATRITSECEAYREKTVLFRKSTDNNDARLYDAKSIMDLFEMAPEEGEKITILVEGEDECARRLLRRIYSAFSSRYSFAIDFERFI